MQILSRKLLESEKLPNPQPKPELSSLITLFLSRNLNLFLPFPHQTSQAFNKA